MVNIDVAARRKVICVSSDQTRESCDTLCVVQVRNRQATLVGKIKTRRQALNKIDPNRELRAVHRRQRKQRKRLKRMLAKIAKQEKKVAVLRNMLENLQQEAQVIEVTSQNRLNITPVVQLQVMCV